MEKIRTVFQPTVELEVDEQRAKLERRLGHVFTGSDEELAAHYQAAGLDLPPSLKPTANGGTGKTTEQQAKGA